MRKVAHGSVGPDDTPFHTYYVTYDLTEITDIAFGGGIAPDGLPVTVSVCCGAE